MGSLVAELAEKLSSATNNFDIDSGTIYVNTSADTVGIGTTTPGSKLDVQGTMQVGVDDTGHDVKFFGATAGAYLEWDESADELELRGGAATPGKLLLSTAETTVVDGNKLGQIDFQAPLDSAGTDAILVGASIHAEADATFSSSVNSTDLVFSTGDSEAATERMRIDSTGKVGIGTTSPSYLLHLYAASGVNRFHSEAATGLAVMHTFTRDSKTAYLGKENSSGTYSFSSGGVADAFIIANYGETSPIQIGHNTPSVTILSTGKVGIGTTSASNQLVVQTDDYTDSGATYPYSGATLHLKSTATNTDRGPGIAFSDGTEDKGFISMNDTGSRGGEFNIYVRTGGGGVSHMMKIPSSGNVQVNNGSVSGISDIRIKKDVADLTDGLNIVNQLKPRTFKFNGKHRMAVDDGETHYGFVADEVLSVASQYVELTKDNIDGERLDDVKTISTGKMIPMLVNAVKELSAEVTALKNAG